MRNRILWLAMALLAAMAVVGASHAQPQGKKKGPPDGFGKKGGPGAGFRREALAVDDIVARIMAFDKNKAGKVTKDDLPERLQHLITLGDTNKDGALDRDEIKMLSTALESFAALVGPGGPGGPGGGFPPKGKGGPGGFGPGGFGPGAPAAIERAVADLNLADKTRDKADAVVKGYREGVRKLMDLARSDLLVKMKEVLGDEDFKNFKEAVDRQPPGPPAFAPFGPGRPPDLEKRIDQLQKELENLRRELKR